MKRLIIGLLILMLIIVLGVTGLLCTNKFVGGLTLSLNSARESALKDNFTQSEKLSNEIKETFKEKEKLLSLFLNHSLIEEIDENLSLLPVFAKSAAKNDFLAHVETVETKLLELIETQKHIF